MINDNLTNLIDSINHISLNHDDLIEVVLDFSSLYKKTHAKDYILIDQCFVDAGFIDQGVRSAREGVVLAMQAITLDEAVEFKELIKRCINLEDQRNIEENICVDEKDKEILRDFFAELRKEVFSRVFSKNKNFNKVTKISKSVLTDRYDSFMAEKF